MELVKSFQEWATSFEKKLHSIDEFCIAINGGKELPKLTKLEESVLELHLDGNKSNAIAQEMGVTTSHISRTLKQIGIKLGKDRRIWAVYSIQK